MIVLLRTVIARVKTFYEKLLQPFSCELLAVYLQNLLVKNYEFNARRSATYIVIFIGAFFMQE